MLAEVLQPFPLPGRMTPCNTHVPWDMHLQRQRLAEGERKRKKIVQPRHTSLQENWRSRNHTWFHTLSHHMHSSKNYCYLSEKGNKALNFYFLDYPKTQQKTGGRVNTRLFSDISWFLPAKNGASGFLRQHDAVPKNKCWNALIPHWKAEFAEFSAVTGIGRIYFNKQKNALAVHEFSVLPLFKMVLIARLYNPFLHRKIWNISPYGLKIPATPKKPFFNLRMHSAYIMSIYIYKYIY